MCAFYCLPAIVKGKHLDVDSCRSFRIFSASLLTLPCVPRVSLLSCKPAYGILLLETLQNLLRALRLKPKLLPMACMAKHDLPPQPPAICLWFTLSSLHYHSFHWLNMPRWFPPQGLCPCCSLCLEHCSLLCVAGSFCSFKSLFKQLFFREVCLDHQITSDHSGHPSLFYCLQSSHH